MSKQSLTEAAKTHEAKMIDALRRLASHEVKLEIAKMRAKIKVLTEQRGTYKEAASRYQKQILELKNENDFLRKSVKQHSNGYIY